MSRRNLDVILEGVLETGDIQSTVESVEENDPDYAAFMEAYYKDEEGLILFCPQCRCENFPSDYGPKEQMACYLCGFTADRSEFKAV